MKGFKQQEDFKGIFLVTLWRLDSNGARVKGMELLELWILPRRAGCVLVGWIQGEAAGKKRPGWTEGIDFGDRAMGLTDD